MEVNKKRSSREVEEEDINNSKKGWKMHQEEGGNRCNRNLPFRSLQEKEGSSGKSRRSHERNNLIVTNVSIGQDVLECIVCFELLEPPIFRCMVGHVVCSSCRDKLPDKCHTCALTTGYSRCYAIEKIVEAIKVPCLNDKYGCKEQITYYQKDDHKKACMFAPCFCPEKGCDLVGSSGLLFNHFTTVHKWSSKQFKYDKYFHLVVNHEHQIIVLLGEDGHLFLLNNRSEPLGCFISIFCVQPEDTKANFSCQLSFSSKNSGAAEHYQKAKFPVRSTSLFDGLPGKWFFFMIPEVYDQRKSTSITLHIKKVLP